MGGNALKAVSVRLTKKNYNRLAADCEAKLRALYPGKRIVALGSYRDKPDFGDCDILVQSDGYDPHQAAKALGAVEVVRNGPVTSLGVLVRPEVPHVNGNVFQVDLIATGEDEFDFALGYFGASDTGNLVGRIAHAMGMAFRHDGLFYYFRDGDYKFREILLTRDFDKALAVLGYAPSDYHAGFDSVEDIYRFVTSTPLFSRDIFLLENRNAKSRVRDKKRAVYMQFLKWCEAHSDLPAFVYPEDKQQWHPRIGMHFPRFYTEYAKAVNDLAQLRAVKAKFNGEWVAKLTGLTGQELGELMKRFKSEFESPEAQHAFVLANSAEELEARVLKTREEMELEMRYYAPLTTGRIVLR